MSGHRAEENGSFVSPRAVYRNIAIVAVDNLVGLTDDLAIPVLEMVKGPNAIMGSGSDTNMYGKDSLLNLAVILGAATSSVTLALYLKAPIEQKQLIVDKNNPPVNPTLADDPNLPYVFVAASPAFTKSSLWQVKDLCPGYYKVVVTAQAGGGKLSLLESHSC